jgi:protein-ribulosamine 3-kinase
MNGIPEALVKIFSTFFKREYNLPLTISSITRIGGGCVSSCACMETSAGKFFIKWKWNAPDNFFAIESKTLKLFNSTSNEFLIFPKPILYGEEDPFNLCPAFLITSWIESKYLLGEEEKLGHGLAQLHKNSADCYGFEEVSFCGATPQDNTLQTDWVAFFIHNRLYYITQLIRQNRNWEASDDQVLERFIRKLPALIPLGMHAPSLVHGDLWSGNVLYSAEGPALVDPAVAYCHREYELSMMLLFGGFPKRVFDAYNESWPLEPGWNNRATIYQLYHLFNHYYLFGGGYKLQALQILRKYY